MQICKSSMNNAFMRNAVDGRPKCKHCSKQFSALGALMGHVHQTACHILHAPPIAANSKDHATAAEGVFAPRGGSSLPSPPASCTPDSVVGDIIPLFERQAVQTAGKAGRVSQLAASIRPEINGGYCRYKCSSSMYVARHACKQHLQIAN